MKQVKPKLFVVDVDGCLIAENFKEIDVSAIKLLRDYCLKAEGLGLPRVVLCTGRPQPFVQALLQIMGAIWPQTPSVIGSGAYLYYPWEDKLVANPVLVKPVLQNWVALKGRIEKIASHMGAKAGLGSEPGISVFPPPSMTVVDLFREIRDSLDGCDLAEVTRSSLCVDVTPRGVNKRAGVQILSGATGVPPSEMVGIGDSANDLPMLETVGYPACPNNADAAVKRVCRYVSGLEATGGVYDIINRVCRDLSVELRDSLPDT